MFLQKDNKMILNISLDDSNGLTQMDPVAAYKIVDNHMKRTSLKYEIFHHTMTIRDRESFMPFSALELILHDADEQQAEDIKESLGKVFSWRSPFDQMSI